MVKILNFKEAPTDDGVAQELAKVASAMASALRVIVLTGSGLAPKPNVEDVRSLLKELSTQSQERVGSAKTIEDIRKVDPVICQLFVLIRDAAIANKGKSKIDSLLEILHDNGTLVRCYSQRMDDIETAYGSHLKIGYSTDVDVVPLNGSLRKFRCLSCERYQDWSEAHREALLMGGMFPVCNMCEESKRPKVGILVPDVSLYSAPTAVTDLVAEDLQKQPDIFLIIGTTLSSGSVRNLAKRISESVRLNGGRVLYVNKVPPMNSACGIIDYAVVAEDERWVDDMSEMFPDKFPQERLMGQVL